MAVVWIVTTGNSDVKLISDYQWGHLREKQRERLKPCYKDFKSLIQDTNSLFLLPARVMGTVYGNAWDTHQKYFKFPLIEEFIKTLKTEQKIPDRIIVLLTDQKSIFSENNEHLRYDRSDPDSPYWRDTVCLEPIFKSYFSQELSASKVEFRFLEPKTIEEGLDNWNSTLALVQKEFEQWNIEKDDHVIVSHQASTPAISSAVQFASLAKFGERVQFLVSNEYQPELTGFVKSSSYLRGIQIEQAKKLLKRYDYSGTQALIEPYLKDDDTKILMNAAIQWNFAKFDDFADEIGKLSDQKFQSLIEQVQDRRKHWWWTAYEAACLALVRLEQKNAVEAFFHSFRSVEGLISKWAEVHYSEHIDPNNDSPKLKASILEDSTLGYFGKSKYKEHREELEKRGSVVLSGFPLYTLLRAAKPSWAKECKEITEFTEKIAPVRNKVFHRLRGLEIADVFDVWLVKDVEKDVEIETLKLKILKSKILKYLNFVSSQSFESLESASLMAKVHQALHDAIERL